MPATAHQLPAWECLELLAGHGIGRLCLIDAGTPIAVPVNYRLGSHQQIIVRTAPNSMVGRYRGPCSLEVDDIDIVHERAWSVIARGTLMPVHDAHGLPDPAPLVAGDRNRWMTLDIAVVSGRRFLLADSGDGWSVDWQLA